jgi:curved DNA-binding protein CbpA
MGNSSSFPAAHSRIYQNLIQIRDPVKRLEIIRTLFASQEYVMSARKAGIYSHLLSYVAKVQSGETPGLLPGEGQQQPQNTYIPQQQKQNVYSLSLSQKQPKTAYQQLVKPKGKEKAIGYFQSSLEALGLEEEVALTEELLKAAYKKAALKAHPDKGGSEEQFEAITRAYAYLTEILRRIHGGRTKESKVEAPSALAETRKEEAVAWKHVEPVRLNPKKLDMDAFNKMFEQTRIPDPDDDGYGDWLTAKESSGNAPKFSGKFNRDVFNKMFEEQARKGEIPRNQLITQPQALTLAPTSGVELGREKSSSYTAAVNSSLKYTDLKQAYTVENTISPQVSHVRVENRDLKQYKAQRDRAPDPLTDQESEQIAAAEKYAADRERQRQLRVAQEDVFANEYFNRMKRLVLTNQ